MQTNRIRIGHGKQALLLQTHSDQPDSYKQIE